jgi:hypothetical protein
MGKYATLQTLTRELREDIPAAELDEYVVWGCRSKAEGEGYHPAGEPRIDWYEVTEQDVAMDLAMQREAGIDDPVATISAGDWRVRVILNVAEDVPVSA